jgi:oligopeptide transport system permease protein
MNEVKHIPKEKFQFAQKEKVLTDKKFDTKPVSFFRDAVRRFAKNKSSIVGMVIIIILVLFSLLAPFISQYKVSDTDGYYRYVLPKVTANASGGFWDGTQKTEQSMGTYQYYLSIGVESGRNAVTKYYDTKTVTVMEGRIETTQTVVSFRKDTYNAVGYKFIYLSAKDYAALQKYQDDNNIQVIYPIQNMTSQGSNVQMYNVNDANYWYKTNLTGTNRGEAVLDENGNFIPIYSTYEDDNYTSKMRITGDPGIENPDAEDRYYYASRNQTGYCVRVCYYDYYVYQHGFEPVFVLGVNGTGQDLFVCIASGTRFSLILGLVVALINFIIGAIYGSFEGYYGGTIDLVMERISDILSGIPFIVMATLFNMHLAKSVGVVGSLIFAFILTGWIGTASTVRTQFYRFKNQEYVLAARTLGAKDRRLIWKHIFPNALGTVVTSAALSIPSVIFSESMLSYLGIISLDDPTTGLTSLGTLLSAAQGNVLNYPHTLLFPALVISLLMISFNLFGNGLRDAFNPTLRGSED